MPCAVSEDGIALRAVRPVRPDKVPRPNELARSRRYPGFRKFRGRCLRHVAVPGRHAAALYRAARDRWIGWSSLQRRQCPFLVAGNSRFLLLSAPGTATTCCWPRRSSIRRASPAPAIAPPTGSTRAPASHAVPAARRSACCRTPCGPTPASSCPAPSRAPPGGPSACPSSSVPRNSNRYATSCAKCPTRATRAAGAGRGSSRARRQDLARLVRPRFRSGRRAAAAGPGPVADGGRHRHGQRATTQYQESRDALYPQREGLPADAARAAARRLPLAGGLDPRSRYRQPTDRAPLDPNSGGRLQLPRVAGLPHPAPPGSASVAR